MVKKRGGIRHTCMLQNLTTTRQIDFMLTTKNVIRIGFVGLSKKNKLTRNIIMKQVLHGLCVF